MLWTGVETCFVFSVLETFLKNQPTSYQHPYHCYLTASPDIVIVSARDSFPPGC